MPQARWFDSGLFVLVLTKLTKKRKGGNMPDERKYLVKIFDSNLLKSSDSINDDHHHPSTLEQLKYHYLFSSCEGERTITAAA